MIGWVGRPLAPRRFARGFIAMVGGALGLLAAANLIVDPHEVLGGGLLPRQVATNFRYASFGVYAAAPARIEAVVMGSSRAQIAFDPPASRAVLGADRLAVLHGTFGAMPDYAAWTRVLLADRAAGRNRLAHVILVIDPDLIGHESGDQTVATRHHPRVTGQNRVQFHGEALFARPRAPFWAKLDDNWRFRDHPLPDPERPAAGTITGLGGWVNIVRAPITRRALTPAHLDHLRAVVALTRAAGVRLTVLLSPQHRHVVAVLGAEELARARDMLAAIAPVWDFQSPLVESDADWVDVAHYTAAVGRMMLARALGPDGAVPAEFGRIYGLVR